MSGRDMQGGSRQAPAVVMRTAFRRVWPVFKLALLLVAIAVICPIIASALIRFDVYWIHQIGVFFGLIAYFGSFALLLFAGLMLIVGFLAMLFFMVFPAKQGCE